MNSLALTLAEGYLATAVPTRKEILALLSGNDMTPVVQAIRNHTPALAADVADEDLAEALVWIRKNCAIKELALMTKETVEATGIQIGESRHDPERDHAYVIKGFTRHASGIHARMAYDDAGQMIGREAPVDLVKTWPVIG